MISPQLFLILFALTFKLDFFYYLYSYLNFSFLKQGQVYMLKINRTSEILIKQESKINELTRASFKLTLHWPAAILAQGLPYQH